MLGHIRPGRRNFPSATARLCSTRVFAVGSCPKISAGTAPPINLGIGTDIFPHNLVEELRTAAILARVAAWLWRMQ